MCVIRMADGAATRGIDGTDDVERHTYTRYLVMRHGKVKGIYMPVVPCIL